MRKVSQEGIDHIKRWEGFRAEAYPDPGSKNGLPWTIGYGHTATARKGMVITKEEGERLLKIDLTKVEKAVSDLVKVPLSDNQFAALVSFAFNIGTEAFRKSTLLKKLNAGDYSSVPSELARWKYNDGKVMDGLINRRASEAGLWAKGSFVSSKDVKTTAEKPQTLTTENISWGVGILSTRGTAITGAGPIQYALAAILVVAFSVGLYLFLTKRLFPR